jgi:hypothetical protein
MSSLAFLLPLICLGLGLAPVWLLRRSAHLRAQDYFVSSGHTPTGVIQNSSIAHALQMTIFAPLFAWGASGDFRLAIVVAVSFGLGVQLVYVMRRPILEFLNDALGRDGSVTVHDFIAGRHGNDPRVRLLAASLTAVAFSSLAVVQAFAVAILLEPVLEGVSSMYAVALFLLILMGVQTIPSGNSGVMRSTQLQLGMIYLGLFGSTALLLYQLVSERRPLAAHGTLAIVVAAACCGLMVCWRRSRYVDTGPLGSASADPDAAAAARESPGSRLLIRLQKVLNVCISVLAVLVIVVAVIGLSADGLAAIARAGTAALQGGTGLSGVALLSLCLLPLLHPIVDMTSWQRIAAFEKDEVLAGLATGVRTAALRRLFRTYAVESALMLLFMCMLGTIAVATVGTAGGMDAMPAFIRRLVVEQNPLAAAAFSLLLVGLCMIALSTMSSLLSASLCAIRYDILPAVLPGRVARAAHGGGEMKATRHAIVAGAALCTVMVGIILIADAVLDIGHISGLAALAFMLHCSQLALVPLVLGPIIGRRSRCFGSVSPAWAIGIIASGAAVAIGAAAVALATGNDWWLWAAAPASLGAGLLLFALGRLQSAVSPAGS